MKAQDRILSLLEPDERVQVLSRQAKQELDERFEKERDWFHDVIWIPFLDELCTQFRTCGRKAEIQPDIFRNTRLFPRFYMSIPEKTELFYWIKIEQLKDRFEVKRFLSVQKQDINLDKHIEDAVEPYRAETLTDLSGITIENLMQDFLEQYESEALQKRTCEGR